MVSFTCAGTSLFAGFAIFSIVGHMAYATGKGIEEVITQGMLFST